MPTPATVFLLTSVAPNDYDAETVLESGSVWLTLAGAERAATQFADGATLSWSGKPEWRLSAPVAEGDHEGEIFLIRQVLLGS